MVEMGGQLHPFNFSGVVLWMMIRLDRWLTNFCALVQSDGCVSSRLGFSPFIDSILVVY